LNRRSWTVFTTKISPDVGLFAIPAPPNSETVSVEKESSLLAADTVKMFVIDREDTTVSDMIA